MQVCKKSNACSWQCYQTFLLHSGLENGLDTPHYEREGGMGSILSN